MDVVELNGVKVALPLMEFDEDEPLSVFKKLKFEFDVFKFVCYMANRVTYVVGDVEDYSTVFCVNGYLYKDINYYVYLSGVCKDSSKVTLNVCAIDIYDSLYSECHYVFDHRLCKVDIQRSKGDSRQVFVELMNYFAHSQMNYSSTKDTQQYFKQRNILVSFRLLDMIKYYYVGSVKAM